MTRLTCHIGVHVWLWAAIGLIGCAANAKAPEPDTRDVLKEWYAEHDAPPERVWVHVDKIEPVPETEPLPPPVDEIAVRPSLPTVPAGASEMHLYSRKGCEACKRARKELEALGVPVRYFTPEQSPKWVEAYATPCFAWKVGDRWFYETEFSDCEQLLLKYVASLPRAAAFTSTPETIQAIIADGPFNIPCQNTFSIGGVGFETGGTLSGEISGNVLTFSEQPKANVGWLGAYVSRLELDGDSVVATAKRFGVTVRKRFKVVSVDE